MDNVLTRQTGAYSQVPTPQYPLLLELLNPASYRPLINLQVFGHRPERLSEDWGTGWCAVVYEQSLQNTEVEPVQVSNLFFFPLRLKVVRSAESVSADVLIVVLP